MPISAMYGTAADYVEYWCITTPAELTPEQISMIESALRRAAGVINMSVLAQGAGNCPFSTSAEQMLRQIGYVMAAVAYNCRCGSPNMDAAEKQMWLNWVSDQLTLIREGKIELCEGETGRDFPDIGVAEVGWTVFQVQHIRDNEQARGL
jgi:hypothetical protein